jgi:RNA polymerase sigma-70 factor (ECF subfamily)
MPFDGVRPEGSLEDLLRQVKPAVERQLRRYPLDPEDQRDIVQSTLFRLVRRMDSFRGEASFSTWLFRVAANEALMLMRVRRRQRALLASLAHGSEAQIGLALTDLSRDLDAELARSETDARVRAALEELSARDRDLIVLHHYRDLPLEEIAGHLGVSESAVRSRMHRARSRLRALLERRELRAFDGAA